MLFQCHDQTAQAPSGRPSPRLGFDMSQVSKWLFDALGEIGEQEVPVLRRGSDRLCHRPGEYPKIVRYPAVRPSSVTRPTEGREGRDRDLGDTLDLEAFLHPECPDLFDRRVRPSIKCPGQNAEGV